MTVAAAKKGYRLTAWARTKEAMGAAHFRLAGDDMHLTIVFHPPDKKRRDLDNCLASLKSALDGIADALRVDDSGWALTITKAAPVPGGRVDVTISPKQQTLALIPMKGVIS